MEEYAGELSAAVLLCSQCGEVQVEKNRRSDFNCHDCNCRVISSTANTRSLGDLCFTKTSAALQTVLRI